MMGSCPGLTVEEKNRTAKEMAAMTAVKVVKRREKKMVLLVLKVGLCVEGGSVLKERSAVLEFGRSCSSCGIGVGGF